EFYFAIVNGYSAFMKKELTDMESRYFFYSGEFMIYMQALRFMTDYLNDDVYYGAKYPDHNRVRAINQITLLQRLIEKQPLLCPGEEIAIQFFNNPLNNKIISFTFATHSLKNSEFGE